MLLLFASLVALILLIAWVRLHAFVALIVAAVLTGLAAGLAPAAVLKSVQMGVGETLGGLALVLGFGVLLGNLLADSGATTVISRRLLALFGPGRAGWALAVTGFIIGLAMFYNAGFIVLAPLVFSVAAETRQPLVPLAIAMAAPLSVTHGFLPPHPGATAVVNMLHADLGKTLLLGLILAVPTGLIAAGLFPRLLQGIRADPPAGIFQEPKKEAAHPPPSFGASLATAVLPVVLMAAATVALLVLPEGHRFRRWSALFGDSGMAVMIAVLALVFYLVIRQRQSPGAVLRGASGAMGAIAGLLLIIAGGGAYKQVLLDTGLAQRLADQMAGLSLSPLITGWLMATVLRISVGSATVAGITAAGIVLPLVRASGTAPELMALAIGAGSLMCSHVNDTGFWLFREWFGLSLKDTFLTWTLMETIIGVSGLIVVLVLSAWL